MVATIDAPRSFQIQFFCFVFVFAVVQNITTGLNNDRSQLLPMTYEFAFLKSRNDTKRFHYEISCFQKEVFSNFVFFALLCRPVTDSHCWEVLSYPMII